MKKLLSALLGINAILIALLTAEAAQAKVKTYDAVKLIVYEKCLSVEISVWERRGGYGFEQMLSGCSSYKP